jgi:hypothetical protein
LDTARSERLTAACEQTTKRNLSKIEQEIAMKKWLTTTMLAAALACPAVLAQQAPRQPQPAPAPQPGQLPAAPAPGAPQPANNGDEANDEAEAHDGDAQIHNAEVDAQRKLELELRHLAKGQHALALARLQAAEGVAALGGNGVAQFRLRGKTEKAAWLGVSTSKVPPALRHHAKLKNKYVGLVVERVEPNSPADEAGLQQFDIIEKVGDQWIVNTEQFSVVLRMNEPGKEVELAIIREGQPQTLKAKLAEKELPVLGAAQEWEGLLAPGAPVAGLWAPGVQGGVVIRDGNLEPMLIEKLRDAENRTTTIKDDEHTLKITTKKGKRNLVASDANGVVIYDGPINTDEEIGNVPEEIREKVQNLEDMPVFQKAAKASKKSPATAPATEKE